MTLNVLMLTTEFTPTVGGIGTYVVELCKRMPSDIRVHVITPKPLLRHGTGDSNEPQYTGVFPDNITVHHLGAGRSVFFGTFPFQINCKTHFRRMLKEYDIDLVHSQSSMPDFFVSPKKEDVPIITTIHTTIEGHIEALRQSREDFTQLNAQEKFAIAFGPILKTLENVYYKSGRRYLTVSEWGRREAAREKGVDDSRIRVAYNGVDTSVYRPDLVDSRWDLLKIARSSGHPTVLFLSRLATRKGIHVLAKAIPKVLERVDCHFIIAGLGEPPEIMAGNDHVTFLGYVPSERLPELYAEADIFVLPSFYENFPISILEAMASECAVVSTRVCGIPEMIEDGVDGLLTEPGDVGSLAESIERLVNDENLRTLYGTRARQSARDKFDWNRTVRTTSECYKDVLSGRM